MALSDTALSSEAARIRQQELSSLRSRLEASLERTRVLEKQVEEGEEERRRMHNAILDLTGSVRVYVRARPFLKSDGEQAADQVLHDTHCVVPVKAYFKRKWSFVLLLFMHTNKLNAGVGGFVGVWSETLGGAVHCAVGSEGGWSTVFRQEPDVTAVTHPFCTQPAMVGNSRA